MAEQIFFQLNLQTGQAIKTFGQLKSETKALRKELDRTKVGTKRFEELKTRIGENSVAIRRFNRDLRKGGTLAQGVAKGMTSAFKQVGVALLAGFAVRRLIDFAKELQQTAIQMEAFARRAQIVFGDSAKEVEDFAKENARSLGLSESAFIGAAASVGDILVPLGLARDTAAEMSTQAVELGSALKEFTGDQRSAAEISEVVAKAFTGEVEGLKSLGVVVNQNDKDFKALIKTKIEDKGLTESQAKATAIFETVLLRSADAIRSFEDNEASLVRQQAQLDADIQTLTENIATGLTPVFANIIGALTAATTGILSFSKSSRELTDDLVLENKALAEQNKEVQTLADRYDELQTQTELSAEEQQEQNRLIEEITTLVPAAASEWDEYNRIIGVNTDALRGNIERQQEILRLKFKERIEELQEALAKRNETLEGSEKRAKKFIEDGLIINRIQQRNAESVARWNEELLNQRRQIAETQLELQDLGIELTDTEKAFIDATLGTALFKKSLEDNTVVTETQIRNVFRLKELIKEQTKIINGEKSSLDAINVALMQRNTLQKELDVLLGKSKETQQERIAESEKEVENIKVRGLELLEQRLDVDKQLDEALEREKLRQQQRLAALVEIGIAESQLTFARIQGAQQLAGALRFSVGENAALQKSLLVLEKGLAIADVIIRLQQETAAITATSATFGPLAPAIAAPQLVAAKIRAGFRIATIAATTIPQLFAEGGFTGESAQSPDSTGERPAGVVHAGEWVASKSMVDSPVTGGIIRQLEGARQHGFADGGFTSFTPTIAPITDNFDIQGQTAALSRVLRTLPNPQVSVVEFDRVRNRVTTVEQSASS